MDEPVRVACVSFLNTAPLIEGLDVCRDIRLEAAVPSTLAGRLFNEQNPADIALVSVIDAATSPEPLALLPVGMIGCEGQTLTVRLFSRVEPSTITRLHADTDSHTSVVLARIVLAERFGVTPEVVALDATARFASDDQDWPEAVLLIGDKVVSGAFPAGTYEYQLDLGEQWRELTGLPFVYAVWACLASASGDERIMAAAALLDRQRRRNAARLDRVVSERAPEKGWPSELARGYVGELLRYEVGPREREAVGEFLRRAADLGLAPRVEPVWGEVEASLAPGV
ncbi:MAG: menaquinone biosynthesis protein [Phycisphaerales bacterium]